MRIRLRNPDREVELPGPMVVRRLLEELGLPSGSVLVIRDRELLTREDHVADDDVVEVRPVISGGSGR